MSKLDCQAQFCYNLLITNRRLPPQGSVLAGALLFRSILKLLAKVAHKAMVRFEYVEYYNPLHWKALGFAG
jgi:hypothetical protein